MCGARRRQCVPNGGLYMPVLTTSRTSHEFDPRRALAKSLVPSSLSPSRAWVARECGCEFVGDALQRRIVDWQGQVVAVIANGQDHVL